MCNRYSSVQLIVPVNCLILGWSYIKGRLTTATIFYEESGWYDGQTWTKPAEVLSRDSLIATYQIQPILQRIQQSFISLVLFLLAGTIVWNFL